jgi:nucleoside-diphosphate-sugar epimerase
MATVVTGGAGFLGSHLVDALIAAGEHVVVIDNLCTGRLPNIEKAVSSAKATFVYADVAAPLDELRVAIRDAFQEPVTAIYHLASPASPESYGALPWETMRANSIGTMNFIELALEYDCPLLFASTSEVYGDPLEHPQRESYFGNVNPIGPRACYDESKRFGEAAMSVGINERGLKGRIVRIFNCYGPRMDVEDGRLIPGILKALAEGRAIPVHGSGQQTRSLTYVDDVVRGLQLVAGSDAAASAPVNLGRDVEHTILEIVEELVAAAGQAPAVVDWVPGRPEDPQRRKPDATRGRSLGWSAEVPLDAGLQKTWKWFTSTSGVYA